MGPNDPVVCRTSSEQKNQLIRQFKDSSSGMLLLMSNVADSLSSFHGLRTFVNT